jgi:hypothetical protein
MTTLNIVNPIEQVVPASKMKPTYGFVSTRSILDTFSAHGWKKVSSQVSRANKMENNGFQKHIIRLEHPDYQTIGGLTEGNNSRPQLVFLNSQFYCHYLI